MNTERPTKEVVTQTGHKAKMLTYFTAGESQEIARLVGENPTVDKNIEVNNKGIVMSLISLDGSSEDIERRLLELPIQDFREISDAVQELVADKKK